MMPEWEPIPLTQEEWKFINFMNEASKDMARDLCIPSCAFTQENTVFSIGYKATEYQVAGDYEQTKPREFFPYQPHSTWTPFRRSYNSIAMQSPEITKIVNNYILHMYVKQQQSRGGV